MSYIELDLQEDALHKFAEQGIRKLEALLAKYADADVVYRLLYPEPA